nr:MAG TPA: hypothetical protein [Bacteriophage sp.]
MKTSSSKNCNSTTSGRRRFKPALYPDGSPDVLSVPFPRFD